VWCSLARLSPSRTVAAFYAYHRQARGMLTSEEILVRVSYVQKYLYKLLSGQDFDAGQALHQVLYFFGIPLYFKTTKEFKL
jgi:hypothetical protein